jgi:hypothetical protein
MGPPSAESIKKNVEDLNVIIYKKSLNAQALQARLFS